MKGGDINFVKKPAPERAMGLVTREEFSIGGKMQRDVKCCKGFLCK
jgi:hypothetical protein